jgi:hypothetical protein
LWRLDESEDESCKELAGDDEEGGDICGQLSPLCIEIVWVFDAKVAEGIYVDPCSGPKSLKPILESRVPSSNKPELTGVALGMKNSSLSCKIPPMSSRSMICGEMRPL